MKRKTAIKIAIECIKKRRRDFAVGHNAWMRAMDFKFAEGDHKKYVRLSQAIEILEKEVEDG